jgi:hypothetical protein
MTVNHRPEPVPVEQPEARRSQLLLRRLDRPSKRSTVSACNFILVIQLPPVRSCPDLIRAPTETGEAAAVRGCPRIKSVG